MIIPIIILTIELLIILFYLFPPIEIVGDSMLPTLKDGQKVWASRIFNLKVGGLYLYPSPKDSSILVVKRLAYLDTKNKTCVFLGDNSLVSYDSRDYGPVSSKKIYARILWYRKNNK